MRKITKYPEKFKQQAVEKLLNAGLGLKQTAESLKVPQATLYGWKQKYATDVVMVNDKKKKKWTAEEKLNAIIKTAPLSESDLGEYLRKHGLHSSDIASWKVEFLQGIQSTGRPRKDAEVFSLRKDKKLLERDLNRKNKALAEMSARVVLLKKSHEIFGVSEDDE